MGIIFLAHHKWRSIEKDASFYCICLHFFIGIQLLKYSIVSRPDRAAKPNLDAVLQPSKDK